MNRNFGLLSLVVGGAVSVGTWVGAIKPADAQITQPISHEMTLQTGGEPLHLELAAYHRRRRSYRRSYYAPSRVYVHRRSGKKSAAIIGGSALGGAAIGALAGGGKGAAIGALVGGAGGAIYDRKTHKKVYRSY